MAEGAKTFKYAIAKESTFKTKPTTGLVRLPLTDPPNVKRDQNFEDVVAVYGAVTRPASSKMPTTYSHAFSIEVPGIPAIFQTTLELMLGKVAGVGPYTFTLDDVLPSFTFYKQSTVKDEVISGCKVKGFTLNAGDTAQVLKVGLSVIGSKQAFETPATNTIPAFVAGMKPFIYKGSIFKLDTVAFPINSLNLKGDWTYDEEDFKASAERGSLGESGLDLGGDLVCDWDAATYARFYDEIEAGTPIALEQTYTNGSDSLVIACPKIVIADLPPQSERGRAKINTNFEAFDSTAGAKDAISAVLTLAA
jgi:hypothetical protein